MKKIFNYFICFIIIFSCICTTAFSADDSVSTYINNASNVNTVFSISDGVATVVVRYYGIEDITTNVVIKTKIQKQFLFFFWQDVEGASWTDYSSALSYVNSHSINVSSGTYKVVVEYTIYGLGGEADIITEEIEAKNK